MFLRQRDIHAIIIVPAPQSSALFGENRTRVGYSSENLAVFLDSPECQALQHWWMDYLVVRSSH